MEEQKKDRDKYLEGMIVWLRETKGITSINMMELVGYMDEYNEYLKQKDGDSHNPGK